MDLIKKEISKGELLQVNTSIDTYYLGTYHQVIQFCEIQSHENPVDGFVWISDFDVCISKKIKIIFTTAIEMISCFFLVQNNPKIRGIFTIDPFEKVIVCNIFEYIVRDYDVIHDMLFMGCAKALSYNNVYDCVINCTSNIKNPSHLEDSHCIQLFWEDSIDQNILSNIQDVLYKIYDWIHTKQKKVIIVCEQGVSRSGACIIAYLMFIGYSFQDAYNLLIAKRPIANPNASFIKQLQSLEHNLRPKDCNVNLIKI